MNCYFTLRQNKLLKVGRVAPRAPGCGGVFQKRQVLAPPHLPGSHANRTSDSCVAAHVLGHKGAPRKARRLRASLSPQRGEGMRVRGGSSRDLILIHEWNVEMASPLTPALPMNVLPVWNWQSGRRGDCRFQTGSTLTRRSGEQSASLGGSWSLSPWRGEGESHPAVENICALGLRAPIPWQFIR